jgi:hypothetical protein
LNATPDNFDTKIVRLTKEHFQVRQQVTAGEDFSGFGGFANLVDFLAAGAGFEPATS